MGAKIKWLCFICLFLFTVISPAYAENRFVQQDTVIPAGQTVENVVVMGGDAEIQGTVKDSVLVIHGDAKIRHNAKVKGMILVIGGSIDQETGSSVSDNVFDIKFEQPVINSLLIGGGLLLGTWFAWLLLSLLLLIIPVLAIQILKNRVHSLEDTIRRSPRNQLLVGIGISLFLLGLSILLSITIVGIPFVILFIAIVILSFVIGLTVLSMMVGRCIPQIEDKDIRLKTFWGAFIITAGINLPVIGSILLLCLVWISLGMVTFVIGERIQFKKNR
jgi:hypothetical protein